VYFDAHDCLIVFESAVSKTISGLFKLVSVSQVSPEHKKSPARNYLAGLFAFLSTGADAAPCIRF
jgi:hypothetical protein